MASPSDPVQNLTQSVLAVFRANGLLLAWGDRFAAPLGLTSARWQMLGAIALAGEARSAPQLASAMGVTRQGAQKQLNLLLAEGLVAQLPNPQHQRSPLYRLTPEGESLYRRIEERWTAAAGRLAASLDGAELAAARRILASLCAALEKDGVGGEP